MVEDKKETTPASELSLAQKVDKIYNSVSDGKEKKEEKKFFKFPRRAKVSKAKARKGWTGVIMLRNNRQMDFMRVPTDEQTTMIEGTPRIATAEDVFYYKGKPVVVYPEWSAKPLSITEHYDQTRREKYNSVGYKLLLNKMKKEVIMTSKAISGLAIFIGVIVLAAIGYFAFKGGLF